MTYLPITSVSLDQFGEGKKICKKNILIFLKF